MLAGKGNPDYSDRQQQPENNMTDGQPDAAAEKPDQIQHQADTAAAGSRVNCHAPKRPQYKCRQLKTLQPERNANDGGTKHHTANAIKQGRIQAAEKQPDQIANRVHHLKITTIELGNEQQHFAIGATALK